MKQILTCFILAAIGLFTLGNLSYTEAEVELVADLCKSEAGTEGLYGKMLVAQVVKNRTNHDRWPDSVKKVVYQSNQFTNPGKAGEEERLAASLVMDFDINVLPESVDSFQRADKSKWGGLTQIIRYKQHSFYGKATEFDNVYIITSNKNLTNLKEIAQIEPTALIAPHYFTDEGFGKVSKQWMDLCSAVYIYGEIDESIQPELSYAMEKQKEVVFK